MFYPSVDIIFYEVGYFGFVADKVNGLDHAF